MDESHRRQRWVYHGVGDSTATSMTSLTLDGGVRHGRIMGGLITADLILYYCKIRHESRFLFIVVVSFQGQFDVQYDVSYQTRERENWSSKADKPNHGGQILFELSNIVVN